MDYLEDIRERSARELKQLREITGTSRAKMADYLGVDIKTYSKMEEGTSKIEFAQMVYIFDRLGINLMPTWLRSENPPLYDGQGTGEPVEKKRSRVVDYCKNHATDYQIECMDMIINARHGSDVTAVLTGDVMNMQCALEYRMLLAQNNLMHWRLCESLGLLQFMDELHPDVKTYEKALIRARDAVLEGKNSYSAVLSDSDNLEGNL